MNNRQRTKRSLLALVAVSVLQSSCRNAAYPQGGGHQNWHMGRWMMGEYWGMGWFGTVAMILFWVLVVVGVVVLLKWLLQNSSGTAGPSADKKSKALEILKERYARGEITKDQFETMKKDILQ